MRKTPSYLKGLAETHGRALADVERLERLQKEVAERLAQAREELNASGILIKKFDARLDPSRIPPVHHWQGRYGKRGALAGAIERILQEAAPDEVLTTEIVIKLQLEFGLDFTTEKECRTWVKNSVLRRLKVLVENGMVERLHDSKSHTELVGRWRWAGGLRI